MPVQSPQVTRWNTTPTREVEVETARNTGESEQDFLDRHSDMVDAAQEEWPQYTPPSS